MTVKLEPKQEDDVLATLGAELVNSNFVVTVDPQEDTLRVFLENYSLVFTRSGKWRIE